MKRLTLVFITLFPILLSAQHQLGWRTDDYAGINAALLNPAATARTPYGWDLNIGEGAFFFANNYAFLENTSVSSLLKASRNEKTVFTFRDDLPSDSNPGEETVVYDFSKNDRYFVQQHTSILGPSLSFRVAPMTRIGFFSRWQFMTTLTDFDQDLGYDQWDSILDSTDFTLDASRITSAAWSEVGINLSQGFQLANGDLHLGINVRKLSGKRAAYFINNKDFTLSKLPNYDGLAGQQFDLEAGFTNNILDEDNINDSPGSGWGFDVGFSYQIDLGDDFYRWEIAGVLSDVGQINYSDAQKHKFNSDILASTINDNYNNLDDARTFESITRILSEDVLGDSLASLQSNELSIHLPTTLSFQVTYRFNEWIKVEGIFFKSVAPKGPSLIRPTTIGIIPRMDRHWWSIAMPVSFYAGEQLRLGLSARLGPIFIGTDQIGSFFKQKEFSGSDIYLGVKFFPLGLRNKGKNKGKAGKSREKGGKDVDCYKF